MARLEGFRVRNFGVLKDVTLGRLWNQQKIEALTPMTAVIGKNGVGKSALFDAFGFLQMLSTSIILKKHATPEGEAVLTKCELTERQILLNLIYTTENTETPGPLHTKLLLQQMGSDALMSFGNVFDKDERGRSVVGPSLF